MPPAPLPFLPSSPLLASALHNKNCCCPLLFRSTPPHPAARCTHPRCPPHAAWPDGPQGICHSQPPRLAATDCKTTHLRTWGKEQGPEDPGARDRSAALLALGGRWRASAAHAAARPLPAPSRPALASKGRVPLTRPSLPVGGSALGPRRPSNPDPRCCPAQQQRAGAGRRAGECHPRPPWVAARRPRLGGFRGPLDPHASPHRLAASSQLWQPT